MRRLLIALATILICTNANADVIDVTRKDKLYVREPLVDNNPAQASENTRRIAKIMAAAPSGASVHFPAGDYYFHGSALPNHGTIETTQTGQIIYGDGADVTNIIQTDGRKDFGFVCKPDLKRVPTATVRIRNKGCRLRDLSVLVDAKLPAGIISSAAVQLAHIKYYPDNNIGIIETTGQGTDYLLDFVNVTGINVGRNLDAGVQSSRFFEVGVDIIGSGGEVKVRDMDRLDAKIGVRLDNGNHCGQGGYYFDNLEMIGRHGVTNGGVLFDWVGGQAPFIRNCTAGFASGIHAGPLGSTGDRLEPTCEGEVVRRPGKDWDWVTWHGHAVVDEPTPAQRTEWYGLPRHITVTRAGSEPRTGGVEWVEGKDYSIETVTQPGDLESASKIHWSTEGPKPGSVYYVSFKQPKEYRVHDLEWGYVMNCQLGEALQMGPDSYALKFEDQGVGYLNPDFRFGVGYGFFITNNMVLNSPFVFDGAVDYIRMDGNTTGVCDIRIRGAGQNRVASRISLSHNQFNSVMVGDYAAQIRIEDSESCGAIKVDAPTYADFITIKGNTLVAPGTPAVDISGKVTNLRIQDNDVRLSGGDGIVVNGAAGGIISGNNTSACTGNGLVLKGSIGMVVRDNIGNKDETTDSRP